MWLSKKKKAADSGCPSGSVHAWELDGVLYKSEQERDRAKKDKELSSLKRRIEYYLKTSGGAHPVDVPNRVFCGGVDAEKKHMSEYAIRYDYYDRILTIPRLAEVLTKDERLLEYLILYNRLKRQK